MRSQTDLRHTRTRVRSRYALLPLEGFPSSNLPLWPGAEVRILAAPPLGARFAQYLIHLPARNAGEQPADGATETFLYLLEGELELVLDGAHRHTLAEGGYALVPHTVGYRVEAAVPSRLLVLRKRFESVEGVGESTPLIGNQAEVPAQVWMDIEGARLQTLVPDELRYDMAMNIFTFEPGYSLPYVETHVMEHGLFFLQGKGLYYLDEEWMEVEAGDFIWMGPYVPQSFYATGTQPAKYIYYKNVNRDVPL